MSSFSISSYSSNGIAFELSKLERYSEAKFIIERAMDNGGDSSEVVVEHYGDILSKVDVS